MNGRALNVAGDSLPTAACNASHSPLQDFKLDTLLDKGMPAFSADIDRRLMALRESLYAISAKRPALEIIEDPAMIPVREMAAKIRCAHSAAGWLTAKEAPQWIAMKWIAKDYFEKNR